MLDQSAKSSIWIQLVFLHLEIVDYRQASQGLSGFIGGSDTISAEFDRDGGDDLYALYAQACEKKDRLCFGFKNRILPQDEYEAKWYNWCDGFNQAATLLLKRNADETDQANR